MSHEGDIVLIHIKDQPTIYARIELIEPDIKKGWYKVTLLLLSIPQQVITWILRDEYINGAQFTMDGNAMKMEEVKRANISASIKESGLKNVDGSNSKPNGKVVPFRANPK
jgi:hypothetical protein